MSYANPTVEAQYLKEIVKRLAKTERWPNGKLPCDYLTMDTETTGFSASTDHIVQVGLCAVRDCKVSNDFGDKAYDSFIIKLPKEAFVGKEAAIAVHHIDYEKSQRCGVEPAVAYKLVHDIVLESKSKGMLVCGHNLFSFDIPFFQTELSRIGLPFQFAQNEVVDTAMLVKAMQIGILPGEQETSYSYWDRVRNFRAKGIYFSLDRYCISRFQLTEKYGVSKDQAHDAGYDCWLTHLVVEELNKIVTA